MDAFFCCSGLRAINYIQFIQYKHKNKSTFGKCAEGATVAILIMWLGLSYYFIDIGEFSMPLMYILILLQLLFQKVFMFLLKLAVFPLVVAIFGLGVCCKRMCCFVRKKEPIDWYMQMGLDPKIITTTNTGDKVIEFVSRRYYKA